MLRRVRQLQVDNSFFLRFRSYNLRFLDVQAKLLQAEFASNSLLVLAILPLDLDRPLCFIELLLRLLPPSFLVRVRTRHRADLGHPRAILRLLVGGIGEPALREPHFPCRLSEPNLRVNCCQVVMWDRRQRHIVVPSRPLKENLA